MRMTQCVIILEFLMASSWNYSTCRVGICTVLIGPGDVNYEFESPNIHTKCWKSAMGKVHIVTKCSDYFSSDSKWLTSSSKCLRVFSRSTWDRVTVSCKRLIVSDWRWTWQQQWYGDHSEIVIILQLPKCPMFPHIFFLHFYFKIQVTDRDKLW